MMTYMNKLIRNSATAGFTLIEMMLVVGIIVVISGAAIHLMSGTVETVKFQKVSTDIQAITAQLKLYEIQNYSPPSTNQGLEAMVKKPSTPPVPPKWRQLMKSVPLDPWGEPYKYRYPGIKNPDGYDIYSYGPDKVESDDDVGNWAMDS